MATGFEKHQNSVMSPQIKVRMLLSWRTPAEYHVFRMAHLNSNFFFPYENPRSVFGSRVRRIPF
jgi:hypothetical protein